MIVPFGAGSSTDILARAVANEMSKDLGQAVFVENKSGASGNIGVAQVARAEGDGYTILMGTNGPLAANLALMKNLKSDPHAELKPVALMGKLPMVLIGSKNAKSTTLQQLVAEMKSDPGSINFGSSNTTSRVWVELLKDMTGSKVETVLYANVGQMMTNLISGEIQYAFENVGPSMTQVRGGKVNAMATTSNNRPSWAKDIPTLVEVGLNKHDLVVWFAMYVPKNTPDARIARLNHSANRALQQESVRRVAMDIGMTVTPGTPQELGDFAALEVKKWKNIADMTGIQLD